MTVTDGIRYLDFNERFEAPTPDDIDETWSLGKTGPTNGLTTLDPNATPPTAADGQNWGSECLHLVLTDNVTSSDGHWEHEINSRSRLTEIGFDIVLVSETLDVNEHVDVIRILDQSDGIFLRWRLVNGPGLGILFGDPTFSNNVSISLDTVYKSRLVWDRVVGNWTWSLNGEEQNNSTTDDWDGKFFTRFLAGCSGSTQDRAAEWYMDNITVRDVSPL